MRIETSISIFPAEGSAKESLELMRSSREVFFVIDRPAYGFYVFYRAAAIETISAYLRRNPETTLVVALDLHEDDCSPEVDESKEEEAKAKSVILRNGVPIGVAVAPPSYRSLGEKGMPPLDDFDNVLRRSESDEVGRFNVRGDSGPTVEPESEIPSPVPRYLVSRTDKKINVGKPFTLTTKISTENLISGIGQAGDVIKGDATGQLDISIHSEKLEILGDSEASIDVPPTGDSPAVRFKLQGNAQGIFSIEVMAWKGSAQVGGNTIYVSVGTSAENKETHAVMDMRDPEVGEYTLEIASEAPNRYRFQLRSDDNTVWPPLYSPELIGTALTTYAGLLSALNTQARNLNKLAPDEQARWLRSMGSLLFKNLLPVELRQALWENRSRLKFLRILSPGDGMPWELLYLSDPAEVEKGAFIADTAIISRWRFGSPPNKVLKKSAPYFVLPEGSPPGAQQEVNSLKVLLGGGVTVTDLAPLLDLIDSGDFSLLHFASHNVTNPTATGGLYIPFGKKKFDITFSGEWTKRQFAAQSPFVFMNACTSGGAAPLYTEMAGWADKFLACGCGAFLGSLWEIRSTSAARFSKTFYEEVNKGATFGEAMRTARNLLGPADPTSFAYTLYGNPFAKLS